MKDFISKFNESLKNCKCCRCFYDLCAEPGRVIAAKMPIMALLFRPFAVFADKFRLLVAVSGVLGLLTAVLATLLGFNYACMSLETSSQFFFCSGSETAYLLNLCLKTFLIALFIQKWYEIAFLGRPFSFSELLRVDAKTFKTVALLILFILLNMFPALSFYVLYVRVPNPDWVVEITFFAFVSLGFLVPFVVMRFYSVFALFLGNEPVPSLKLIWRRGSGNNFRIILALFVIIVIMMMILINMYAGLRNIEDGYVNYVGIVGEFVYDTVFLMLLSLLVNHAYVQKQLLFGDNADAE